MKSVFDSLLISLLKGCQKIYGGRLKSLCVFGSVAAGTMRPDSDIDILLVCDPLPRGRMARVREFEAVEGTCAEAMAKAAQQGIVTTFSPMIKTPGEVQQGSPVFLDMTDTARILLDRDRFLLGYLESLRERLARLGARRVMFGGGYYWLLKPDLKTGEEISL
jgi:hypothetical protein